MEVGETDLNNLLIEHSGKAISMNFIRYIWEQVSRAATLGGGGETRFDESRKGR